MSGYYFFFPLSGIKTDIPEDHLCSFQEAMTVQSDMTNLFGTACGFTGLTPTGANFISPEGGTLVYLGITTPIGTIYAATLVNEKKAGDGVWHLSPGGPVWVTTPVPKPVPSVPNPTNVVFPGFGPGSSIGGSQPQESSTEQKVDKIIRMLAAANLKDPQG